MTKSFPIHVCGERMVRRGKRHNSEVQRWWCPVCEKWAVVRGAATGLRGKTGYGFARVIVGVAHGLSIHAIAQVTGMDWMTVKRRIVLAVNEAEQKFMKRPPGVGHGWRLVDLPSGCHEPGKAAIGDNRTTKRLLDWEPGPAARDVLIERLGREPDPGLPGDQAWLTAALGESAQDWKQAEQRLWVILAQSNGWKFDYGLAPSNVKRNQGDPGATK